MAAGVALLILDMQNDILAFHQRDHHVEEVIRTIKGLADWAHASNVPVIYSRVAFRPSYVDALPGMPIIKERHMLDETQRGSAIIDELKPEENDTVVVKRRIGVFYNTDLEVVLRSMRAQTLLFTGMSTSRVVESTVREAQNRDFKNIVISDGCAATSPELHENSLRSMADFFAEIMTAAEAKAKFS